MVTPQELKDNQDILYSYKSQILEYECPVLDGFHFFIINSDSTLSKRYKGELTLGLDELQELTYLGIGFSPEGETNFTGQQKNQQEDRILRPGDVVIGNFYTNQESRKPQVIKIELTNEEVIQALTTLGFNVKGYSYGKGIVSCSFTLELDKPE